VVYLKVISYIQSAKKFTLFKVMNKTICVIGTGYVGLPLCIEFSKFFKVIGYDVRKERILSLKKNYDTNNDIGKNELNILKRIKLFLLINFKRLQY
jgi:UDP-N-acetyl-D-mannosaminuronate dehydrogenase